MEINEDDSVSQNLEVNQDELEFATSEPWRNLISFWFLGLCNNFGYVVMLSAAFDILKQQQGKVNDQPHKGFYCNPTSTGLVLLADVLPSLIIKLTAPFYMQQINYHFRVLACVLLLTGSLITVAYSKSVGVSILGVVLASLSSGIGEITFLAFSSYFSKATISAWSSGTGMAGVAGSLAFACLTQLGVSARSTLMILLVVPAVWAINFWVVLKMPQQFRLNCSNEYESLIQENSSNEDRVSYMSLKDKLKFIIPLWKYMVPLFMVYLAEYTINQGLYELLYYNTWLKQAEQYRWFQVDYQIGVFISRSSVSFFRIRNITIPAVLQWGILIFFLFEVCFTFIPSIFITFAVILIEGLFGGAVYVNAFTSISEDVDGSAREFSLGAASMADSIGISIAGVISLPLHNVLCSLKLKS